MKKCIAAVLAALIALSACSVAVFAAEPAADGATDATAPAQTTVSSDKYYAYLQEANKQKSATADTYIPADGYTSSDGAVVTPVGTYTDDNGVAKNNIIKWTGEKGSLTYTFTVPETGVYNIALEYLPIAGRGLPLVFGFKFDGEAPYDQLNSINFERTWIDSKPEGVSDGDGNLYASEQIELFLYKKIYAMDTTGQYVDPLKVMLTAGTHTVTVTADSGECYFAGVVLAAPHDVPTYEEAKAEYEAKGYNNYSGNEIILEGEAAKYKSTSSTTPLIDNSDPSIRSIAEESSDATDAFKEKINFIGSTGWQAPNETLTWILEVPEDGLYKMAFRFRQDKVINGNSFRDFKIDGVSPFEEAEKISFGYSGNWQFQEFQIYECEECGKKAYSELKVCPNTDCAAKKSVKGESALVYLTKGTHEISLTVTLGEFGEISRAINEITYEIGQLYLSISMLTGDTIDTGRSYEFFDQIPNFEQTLKKNIAELDSLCKKITEITGEDSSTYISTIKNMMRVMQEMLDNPYTAQRYVGNYYDNYCSLSALVADIAKLPLDIDQIIFAAPEKEYEFTMAKFWDKTVYSFNRFIVSFMDDYRYTTKGDDGKTTLTMWVTWGRDQTQILTSLVKDSFETEHPDINVNIQIVGASLIQAILSGTGPDLLLGQLRTEPVNYGMRGALVDLKAEFDDFDEVATRFQTSALDPYVLGKSVYGIPDTQSFNIMYYRTDIFEELGLQVPRTWEEFRNVTALLQRQNLGVAMPGAGDLHYYATFLMQNNAELYNDTHTATAVNEGTAVETFVFWTDFYTNLGYDTAFSFYNRFRAGTMPLGVGPYSEYVTFSQAAPEITGKWAIARMPGTMQEDGTINYAQADTGTACVIPKINTEKRKEAWEFLKWWTSDNTQYRYSTMVEAVLGEVGRVQTANVEALKRLSWESDDVEILLDTWSDVKGLVEIPGGYYVTRSIYQAFWNVVNLSENPKDMIVKWGKVADDEITRKREEYKDELAKH